MEDKTKYATISYLEKGNDMLRELIFEIDESVSFSDLKGKEFNSFMRGAFAELYGGDESAINFRTLRVSELKDKKPYQDVIWGICKENTGELSTCVAIENSNVQSTLDVYHSDGKCNIEDFSCSIEKLEELINEKNFEELKSYYQVRNPYDSVTILMDMLNSINEDTGVSIRDRRTRQKRFPSGISKIIQKRKEVA